MYLQLGSLKPPISDNDTKLYLINWLEELKVPYHYLNQEIHTKVCTRPKVSLASKLVVLIPVFLLVISIITPTLKDYMARHSNRVHPFTP